MFTPMAYTNITCYNSVMDNFVNNNNVTIERVEVYSILLHQLCSTPDNDDGDNSGLALGLGIGLGLGIPLLGILVYMLMASRRTRQGTNNSAHESFL